MQVEFLYPFVLALIPVFLLLLIGAVKYSRVKRNGPIKRSLIFHALAGILLLLALAGMNIKWTSKSVTTVYVADLSDSTKFYQENVASFIEEAIRKMPEDQYAGIVTFGADTKLQQFVSDRKAFSGFDAVPVRTGTNMEEAVSVALALLKEDTAKRIVLLTDGYENAGAVENVAASVLANHVDFKVFQIERNDFSEVYVNHLEVPPKINIGDQFTVKMDVVSSKATTAVIYLYSGRTLKAQENVELTTGSNQFVFSDVQTDGGLKTYRVVVDAADDTEVINNEYSAYTVIEAPPQILIVEGIGGNSAEFQKLLTAVNVNFKVVTPAGTPENINQMLEYKSIILVNAHHDDLKEGFINSLDTYVKDYAGGLIAVGGDNSFALGAYKDTPLETVLPVYMDLRGEKEIPPLAIALVMDRSGSMSDGNGQITNLDLAKEAAIEALDSLRPIDQIGVMSFDDSFTWNSKLQSAGNHDQVMEDILGISLGGGTNIYPALEAAVNAMKQNEFGIKHIILLTDGQDGHRDYNSLINELAAHGITLSTVSVGAGADVGMLSKLAADGGGRYYHTDISTNIPRIFAQEVFLSVKSYLVNREFTPVLAGSHEILSAVSAEGLPTMLGYIASTRKEFARSLLVSDQDDPILTIWQYGLGKTAAFNSDVENKWTGNYAGHADYALMWKNLIDYTVSDVEGGGNSATIEADGNAAVITYQTDSSTAGTAVTAVYTFEDGTQGETVLHPVAPGVYSGDFQTDEVGVYSINIRQSDGEEVTTSLNTAYVMQYSREYRYGGEENILDSFVRMVRGRFIADPAEVFEGPIETVRTRMSLTTALLLWALAVFMIDVIWRRLNLNLNLTQKTADRIRNVKETAKVRRIKKEEAEKKKQVDVAGLKKTVAKEQKIYNNSKKEPKIEEPQEPAAKAAKPVSKKSRKAEAPSVDKNEGLLDTSALLNRKKERDTDS